MGFLSVIVAAAAGWVFGAAWYMALARPWMAAAGIETDENGRPVGQSALPYALSALAMLLVAGMMRHMLAASDVTSPVGSLVSGLGVGLFFIAPWIAINNAYAMRPARLTLIDGGYAVFGCGVIGLVLGLFA